MLKYYVILLLASSFYVQCEDNIDLQKGLFDVPFGSEENVVIQNIGEPSGIIKDRHGGELWLYSDNIYIKMHEKHFVGLTIGHGELVVSGSLSIDMHQVDKYKDITRNITIFSMIKFGDGIDHVKDILAKQGFKIIENIQNRQISFKNDNYIITFKFMGAKKGTSPNLEFKYELSLVIIETNEE